LRRCSPSVAPGAAGELPICAVGGGDQLACPIGVGALVRHAQYSEWGPGAVAISFPLAVLAAACPARYHRETIPDRNQRLSLGRLDPVR
jgi:hypothetical protein